MSRLFVAHGVYSQSRTTRQKQRRESVSRDIVRTREDRYRRSTHQKRQKRASHAKNARRGHSVQQDCE
jgi:hypothetical protein